jgi:hypothetical protein
MSIGSVYYDPKHAAGFGSVGKLVKASKTKKKDVEEWLSGQNPCTLHKPVWKMFHRNPHTATNIDVFWEMDLAVLSSLSKPNDKYKFLLKVIRLFSHYSWSVPLKNKTASSNTTALKYLFQNRKPVTIQSKVLNLLMQLSSST